MKNNNTGTAPNQTVNNQKIQEVLSALLRLSIASYPFPRLMQEFLTLIASFPWLEVQPKGALFLVDENNPANLILAAHHNIAKPILQKCAHLPFGRCLCGRAAQSGKIVFVNQIDEQHENCCENMSPHGHYCIPIKSIDDTILGVFTLYTQDGVERRPEIEAILQTAAAAVAGMIRLHLCETASRASEASYRAITNAAADAIVMMDNHGLITFWNPAAEKLFGYAYPEVVGKKLHDIIVPANYAAAYKSALHEFFKSGDGKLFGQTTEVNGQHRDGHEIPIELSLSRIQLKNHWHAIGIIRNITTRKLIEQDKEKLNRHLQQVDRIEAIGTLAGGIAHDFNNITASILGFAEMVQGNLPKDSQTYEDMGHIISAAQRGKDITRQLLTFSRQTDQENSVIHLQPLIAEATKLIRASIPANIELHTNITRTKINIMASATRIHQVLINLCANAHHAIGRQNGVIDISLEVIDHELSGNDTDTGLPVGKYAKLTVSDTGSGISPETLTHIFEPFFTTSPQGEGTGLGLSIAHGIIADLDGVIKVRNNPDRGASFDIFIPICREQEAVSAPTAPAAPESGSGLILIVEDEQSLAEITARSLRKAGYDTVIRPNGQEALSEFTKQPDKFDLILTDQLMPQMTGTKMAAEILKSRPDTPIIIMTGTWDKRLLKNARRLGIKKVIVKPISINELLAAIKDLLTIGNGRG